jgi:hypothetical protein
VPSSNNIDVILYYTILDSFINYSEGWRIEIFRELNLARVHYKYNEEEGLVGD